MAAKRKTPKPFFKERKDFLRRCLGEKIKNYTAEMTAVTKIFERFDNDIDFLNKVKPPSFLKDSLLWFLTEEGNKFLKKKHKKFYYKLEEFSLPVNLGEKFGEDVIEKKQQTIRSFLNE